MILEDDVSKKLLYIFAILLSVGVVLAEDYDVSVTHIDSNLYKIDTMDIYVQTRYCYEYVYYEDSILRMDGRTGEIVFLNSGYSCGVAGVYGDAEVDSGRYAVIITREEDNWYEIIGMDIFIRTSICLELSIMDDATLRVSAGGFGTLYFPNGRDCMVEGLYGRLSL